MVIFVFGEEGVGGGGGLGGVCLGEAGLFFFLCCSVLWVVWYDTGKREVTLSSGWWGDV